MYYENKNLAICLLATLLLSVATAVTAAEKVTYQEHVRPILREHCFACHNQDDAESSLALDSYDGIITGGAGGEVVTASHLDSSRLWKLVTHQEEPKMPPENKLPDAQLQVLRSWIEGGLLKNSGSKPRKSSKPAIAKIDPAHLGKPVGVPAMPEQLFHEPVLWTPTAGPVNAIATSPWGPLAAIAWQRQVSFYHTETHAFLGIIAYVEGVPRIVRFSPDGSLILVAGGRHAAAGSASLFDVKTGARLASFGDELDIVLAADINADLSLVALGGPKKKVRVFHVADGTLAYTLDKHTDWITAVGFSPDGRLLATADRSGNALLWNAAGGLERADLRGHKATITAIDWRTDAALVATASEDGTVRLWNSQGKQTKSFTAHPGGVLSVQFAKTGELVTTGRDNHIKTWKPDGGAKADLGKFPGITLAAAFTHDGAQILASDYTGAVRLLDVASKQTIATFHANPQRLSQRLAAAQKALQQTQQEMASSETQLNEKLESLDQAKAAHVAHEKKMAAAQNALAAEQKFLAADKNVEAAVAALAQVANETAGLPDLANLTEQHSQAQTALTAAKQQFQAAEKIKAFLAKQQARFAAATDQFSDELLKQQTEQQEAAKRLGKLTEEHRHAAKHLAEHRRRLAEVTRQLESLQATLAKLKSSDKKIQEEEQQLAAQLGTVQTEAEAAQQQRELLLTRQKDFSAAAALRKKYAPKNSPPNNQKP